MVKMKTTKTTTAKVTHRIELNEADILAAFKAPKGATVDHTHDCWIADDRPLVIEWTETVGPTEEEE